MSIGMMGTEASSSLLPKARAAAKAATERAYYNNLRQRRKQIAKNLRQQKNEVSVSVYKT